MTDTIVKLNGQYYRQRMFNGTPRYMPVRNPAKLLKDLSEINPHAMKAISSHTVHLMHHNHLKLIVQASRLMVGPILAGHHFYSAEDLPGIAAIENPVTIEDILEENEVVNEELL